MSNYNPEVVYNEAYDAGMKAGSENVPVPMHVMSANRVEIVDDGVCGFAYVHIKPARGKFVNWLKKNNIGRKSEYYGGYSIGVSAFNQSMSRKEAFAGAFCEVLSKYGINCYPRSQID